jgi:S-adenosylmethionine:tRNA ribosyltransferase-isomerase
MELEQLQQLITNHRFIMSVGTTSLRSLESLYWIGYKISQGLIKDTDPLKLEQWEPYTCNSGLSLKESLTILYEYIRSQGKGRLEASTSIMIVPGYRFKVIKALITNFHLPKSTLLLLIAALIGNDWKKVYDFALTHKFRFLSYGDASLLVP